MALIKTSYCVVIFLKILLCASQLHNPYPKTLTGTSGRYFDLSNDHSLSSSMESSSEEESFESDEVYPTAFLAGHINSGGEIFDEEDPIRFSMLPRRRVRRRIFPGVGKALDRSRGDRNPWKSGRDNHEEPETATSAVKRSGPMGSDLLYALYPSLTPAKWPAVPSKDPGSIPYDDVLQISQPIEKKAVKKAVKKAAKKSERDVEELIQLTKQSKIKTDHSQRSHEDDPYVTDDRYYRREDKQFRGGHDQWRVQKREPKPKVRIAKQLKEEIARYAEQNGVSATVSYYKGKVDFLLRRGSVEKFVRRYKRRKERQRLRRLIKS